MQGLPAAQRTPEAAARIHLRVHLQRANLQCRQQLPAGHLAWTVPCNTTAIPGLSPATPQLSQGPAVSTDDGSAPAQPSLPYLSPRFWAALVSCPPWLCVLLSIPLRSSSQPCCHSYVAPGTMWEPRQGDKSWRDSNYFCQINKLIKLPFILQI